MARPSRHEWAMALARETAKRSTCLRRAVGCILLDSHGYVLATGYNGVASGMKHCNEPYTWLPDTIEEETSFPNACTGAASPSGTNLDACQAIHAEQNALLQCRDVHAIESCYVTASPCVTCAKLLMNTSCSMIMFDEEYPQPEAKRLWQQRQGLWVQMKNTADPQ